MKIILKFIVYTFLFGVIIFISCKKEYSCENCSDQGHPPIARAGTDTTIILPIDSLRLDGSASSDPNGTITMYRWRKVAGPAAFNIISPSSVRTIVKNLIAGSYQFELKVTDDRGLFATDTVQVTVDSLNVINHAPIANAGPDLTITLPTNVATLYGSGSTDPDNNITNYQWTKISGPRSFSMANSNTVIAQVTSLVQGIYQFQLKVIDAGGLFSTDTMQVKIDPAPISALSGKEFIFENLIWEIDSLDLGPPGSVIVNVPPSDSFSVQNLIDM